MNAACSVHFSVEMTAMQQMNRTQYKAMGSVHFRLQTEAPFRSSAPFLGAKERKIPTVDMA